MLGYGDERLATAVEAAGGIGSIPCSGMPPDSLRSLLQRNRGKRLCYNFFCHRVLEAPPVASADWIKVLQPFYEKEGIQMTAEQIQVKLDSQKPTSFSAEQLLTLLEEQKNFGGGRLLVSFHFGLPPDPLWEQLKASRAFTTLCTATTVEEALYLKTKQVDVIVGQGAEAGGHRGLFLPSSRIDEQLGIMSLIPRLRRALGDDAHLVAAGGIVDVQTARAAVDLGADGVQCGTALLLTQEAATSTVHRQALLDAQTYGTPQTTITNVFSGRPARGLRNTLVEHLGPIRADAPPYPTAGPHLVPLRQHAEPTGRSDYSQLWAGQNLSGCFDGLAGEKVAEIAAAFTLRRHVRHRLPRRAECGRLIYYHPPLYTSLSPQVVKQYETPHTTENENP